MAFNVNVRLVENMVNSHDGSVKVVKVITQYKTLGITLTLETTNRVISQSHDEGCDEAISVADIDTVAAASSGTLEATSTEEVVKVADRASNDDMLSVVLETCREEGLRLTAFSASASVAKSKSLPLPQLLFITVTEACEILEKVTSFGKERNSQV